MKGKIAALLILLFLLTTTACSDTNKSFITDCYLTLSGKIHITLNYQKETQEFTDLYKVTVGERGYKNNAGSYISGESIQVTADVSDENDLIPGTVYEIYIRSWGPYIRAKALYKSDRRFTIIKESLHVKP